MRDQHRAAALCLLLACFSFFGPAHAAPLPREAVPEALKSWLPWVLHGQEFVACPMSLNNTEERSCAWPSSLDIDPTPGKAGFTLTVESFSARTQVTLPGNAEFWPQTVMVDGKPAVVTAHEGTPTISLTEGRHRITGRFLWTEMPQSLSVPTDAGILRVQTAKGLVERAADESGEVWLSAEAAGEQESEALSLRSFRRIDDGQPLRVLSRFELTFSGKPREITLDNALLPGFTPLALNSPLPARLGADGSLRLQARAGVHVIEVEGRRMDRVLELMLPKTAKQEEVWSWQAHRDLRVVDVAGTTVDPRQSNVPAPWQQLPAYLLQPGEKLAFAERRRGDPEPEADKLNLARTLWLDFDGGGFTVQDRIGGTLSRSWRLEARAPLALGHVLSDDFDQYITRLAADSPAGFEVRHGQAAITADSRIDGSTRQLFASGWNTAFQQANTELRLPPGWQLLHAGGVDRAGGSWLSAWTLWDFFFVLLIALAAWKTRGWQAGLLLGATLVLVWHLPGSPGWLWLVAIGLIAAGAALIGTRFARVLHALLAIVAAVLLLQGLFFSVDQVRLALYPALEQPVSAESFASGGLAQSQALEAPMAAAPAPMMEMEASKDAMPDQRERDAKVAPSKPKMASKTQIYRQAIDANAKVQTGPGLTNWQWHSHVLSLQGPVSAEQQIDLWLLPPWAHALLRVLSVILLFAAFWQLFLRGRKLAWTLPKQALPTLLGALLIGSLGFAPPDAQAASAPAPQTQALPGEGFQPWLDELRSKLLAAPDCLPACAEVPRLAVEADAGRLLLRLEAHAAETLALPLPGQAAQLRIRSVLIDAQPASLRRDEEGQLWIRVPQGVHQIVMEADIADTATVNIALPLVPHHLDTRLAGWTLSGIDARGVPQGALTLTRNAGGGKANSGTARDALPPLVRVTRTLDFAERWTVNTQVERIAPSLAPQQVTIALLPGEQITDPSVRLVDGQAILTLGAANTASFSSALSEAPSLKLKAAAQPNQIEVWRATADTRWHLRHSGLAPVQHQSEQLWQPSWQPWPGEEVTLELSRPQGITGPSLTMDSLRLQTQPGARVTSVSAELVLRSSLGATHVVQLPEGAELESVLIDGAAQPLRAEGRKLALPIHPGSQTILIRWREPQGVATLQHSAQFDAGVAGVNAYTALELGADRWILAVGGPRLGPAVLLWGLLIVVLGVAVALARARFAPLGIGAWLLIALGTAQASLYSALIVALWFLLLAARGQVGAKLPRWAFNLLQITLVLFSLIALGVLFHAIQTGLLGSPDMLIEGNGSHGRSLFWYQDRITGAAPSAWAFSLPIWIYRGLMLAWALWLAASVLKWVRWAWTLFGTDGYWRPAPPKPAKPVKTGTRPTRPADESAEP
ncbi:hypothetical protein GCM10027046_05930 [Uliginosibacterium flavum]|uniref:Uncharacterized protein n=1 Tax=Uliginosibacterium flavum TaxID=1396831 RepID=A0ABV2TLC7_9RHOO